MEKRKVQEAVERYLKREGATSFEPKAALFDMDGVLYNSMPFHVRSWKAVAEKYHFDVRPEEFYMFEGQTGHDTINELYRRTFHKDATEDEIKEIYHEKTQLFSLYSTGEVMPGAVDVLTCAKQTGFKIVLVTGSGQETLLDRINNNFPGFFTRERMVTAFDVQNGKPNPEPYLIGLKKAGIFSNQAVVIENAPLGVQAAVAAHIFTIAVNTGPLPDDVLLGRGASLLYPSMKSLADDWENLFSIIHTLS